MLAEMPSEALADGDVGALLAEWGETPSDPLLSEHTLLRLRSGVGAAWVVGAPPDAVLTLVPDTTGGSGLVEVAGRARSDTELVWESARRALLERAAAEGLHPLTALDRSDVFPGVADLGVVIRMSRALVDFASVDPGPGMGPSDVASILSINNEAFAGHPENGSWTIADLEERMAESWFERKGLLVERRSAEVVGFCWTKVHPDGVGEIYVLAVDPRWHGRGIGYDLAKRGLSHLRMSRGCDRAIVYTSDDNDGAIRLYRNLGFEVDRTVRRVRLDTG